MKVGFAVVDYSPPAGLPLMGNYRDDYGSRGMHDPLCACAFVFNGEGGKAAVLSVDICMLDRTNVALMRHYIRDRVDIDPSNILIAATHTHSGPAPMRLGPLPKAPDAEAREFLTRAAEAVVLASGDLRETHLRVGSVEAQGLSFNRRLLCKDGATRMNWERLDPGFVLRPRGAIDPRVTVVSAWRDGRPAAAAVNFGLHPAILAGENWLYSADFPGRLREAIASVHGAEFLTAFWNACCGNVNHIDYADPLQGRGYKEVQRIGCALAMSACRAMRAGIAMRGECVAASSERVPLTRTRIGEDERRRCERIMADARRRPPAGQMDGLPEEYWAATRLDMYARQHQDDAVEVLVLRVGDLGIVGLPGEFFCEFGMDIRAESPATHTIVIALANDAIGYVPTMAAFEEGGYEPSIGACFYTKDAGERMAASAIRQLHALFPEEAEL